MDPLYSIIIPAYNEEDYIQETLAAVIVAMNSLPYHGECIVVNNNSTDDTEKRVKTVNYPVRIITAPEHNIATVRNHGAQVAGGKYLIFIDADTIINKDLLGHVLNLLMNNKISMGSAQLKFSHKDTHIIYRKLWKLTSQIFLKNHYGACMFCRADLFWNVGGFDKTKKIGEDWDFGMRCEEYIKKNKDLPPVQFIDKYACLTSGRMFNKLDLKTRSKLFYMAMTKNIEEANVDEQLLRYWYRKR